MTDIDFKPGVSHKIYKEELISRLSRYPKDWIYKPTNLEIELSNECNIRCADCAIIDDLNEKKQELDTSLIIKTLQDASSIGMMNYSLTGGEPFLRLDAVVDIISSSALDFAKINTNGFAFSSVSKSKDIVNRIVNTGIYGKNRYLRPFIKVSLGQQTLAGVPLVNSINLIWSLVDFVLPEMLGLGFIVFSENQESVNLIKKEFNSLMNANFSNIDLNELAIDFSEIDLEKCGYLLDASDQSVISIKKIIHEYKDLSLNCSCFEDKMHNNFIGTKILIRYSGEVYACSSFSHVFKLGNIYENSLYEIIESANKNKNVIKVFSNGIYEFINTDKELLARKARRKSGICNICKMLNSDSSA